MSFSNFFYAIISNFFSPFKILSKLNELIKNGFNRKNFFYYSLLLYLLSSVSLILSGYIVNKNGDFGLLTIQIFLNLFSDLFYIFISFSIFHFFKTKIDFEHFSTLYFISTYFYFILLPIILILNIFNEQTRIISNLIFFGLSIFAIAIKVYVYSLFVNNSKEKGFLYFILPTILVLSFVFFIFYFLFLSILTQVKMQMLR